MKSFKYEDAKKHLFVFEILLGILLTASVAALSGLRYENNDDVIISGLLSGNLLGISQWRIFQYVHVVSAFPLHLLYDLLPSIPWYGAWQILLRFLAFFLPLNAINSNAKKWSSFMTVTFTWTMLYLSFWMMHARIQYTSTAEIVAFMGFICFTFQKNRRKALLSFIAMELTAYSVRPNGMELVLPLGASIFLLDSLRGTDRKKTLKKIFLGVCVCAAIIATGELLTRLVCVNKEYAMANAANDGRGEMFDYAGFPPYEEVADVLTSKNVSREKYEAFSHYLILDWDVSDGALTELAAIASKNAGSTKASLTEILKKMAETTFQTHLGTLSRILACAWIVALFSLFFFQRFQYLFVVAGYHFAKLITWGYLFYKGRTPSRVTYPLLLIETIVAACIFLRVILDCQESQTQKENARKSLWNSLHFVAWIGCVALIALISLKGMLNQYRHLTSQENATVLIETAHDQMEAYCNSRPNDLFITSNEIYAYVQRHLFDAGSANNNYVYSGGWHSLLPDSLSHTANYLSQDKACYYVVSRSVQPSVLETYLNYLKEYFGSTPVLSDSLEVATGDVFDVYRLR